jgi:hypothetical protein
MSSHEVKFIVNPNAHLGRAWRTAADLCPIVDEFGDADWAALCEHPPRFSADNVALTASISCSLHMK